MKQLTVLNLINVHQISNLPLKLNHYKAAFPCHLITLHKRTKSPFAQGQISLKLLNELNLRFEPFHFVWTHNLNLSHSNKKLAIDT